MPQDSKFNLFISYAHADESYFKIFLSNLSSQFDLNYWNIWTDKNILIGNDWFKSIQESMKQSDVAVLLISPDFLSSTFVRAEELTTFSNLKKNKPSFVFAPIFLRDCDFTRWAELSKLQMFSALGGDYGITGDNSKTSLMPFAKLCRFDDGGGLIPNPYRDTYFKNLVKEVEKNLNINKTLSEGAGINYDKAKGIERLQNLKDIFIPLPISEEGTDIRNKFINSSEDKLKFDKSTWPHKITPGIDESADLPAGFIYSIFIIGTAKDLDDRIFKKPYELAKQANTQSGLPFTIIWLLNEAAKSALDERPDALDLKKYPIYQGADYTEIFKLIEGFDTLVKKQINELSGSFTQKKIYLFWNEKDQEMDLLKKAFKNLNEDKHFNPTHLYTPSLEDEKNEIDDCQGAMIFYGPDSNINWYGPRENIITKVIARKGRYAAAVCVADEESKIDDKITYINKKMSPVIKGEKDLDRGLTDFKNKFFAD